MPVVRDDVTPLLKAIKERLREPAPALLGPVADYVREVVLHRQFATEGYATPWAPLAEATINHRPAFEAALAGGPLEASLTERGAPGAYAEMRDGRTVAIGTDDPVAPYHQTGTYRMPQRLLVPDSIPDEDQRYIADIVAGWLAGPP